VPFVGAWTLFLAVLFGLGSVALLTYRGLGVTIIMLPVGLVVGIIGLLMFVGGLFARIGGRRTA
jgi:hypothetical protein